MSLPLTGVQFRVQHLPIHLGCPINNEGSEEHAELRFGNDLSNFGPSSRDPIDYSIQKCVYKYTDKNHFDRIIIDDSIAFDSHFESGNLFAAFRVNLSHSASYPEGLKQREQTYDLFMHSDLYTNASTQWFYFKVIRPKTLQRKQAITFRIKNFRKPDSLFKRGMKPLVYSSLTKQWSRNCISVKYTPTSDHCSLYFQEVMGSMNSLYVGSSGRRQHSKVALTDLYFTLSFSYVFAENEESCSFAYCYPYTYTDLQQYLDNLSKDIRRTQICRRTQLCRTVCGNRCDLLTITNPCVDETELLQRRVVVYSARVHPGETSSSFIMHGIIDFLTSDESEAQALRSKFIYKIGE
jgi:hypothetical protein